MEEKGTFSPISCGFIVVCLGEERTEGWGFYFSSWRRGRRGDDEMLTCCSLFSSDAVLDARAVVVDAEPERHAAMFKKWLPTPGLVATLGSAVT